MNAFVRIAQVLTWHQKRAELVRTIRQLGEDHDWDDIESAVREARYAEREELTNDSEHNSPGR